MIKAIKPNRHDEGMIFTDGSYLQYSHNQDCCESNYLDWSSLDDTGFWESEFEEIKIEAWEYGVRVNGFSINAYSDQNGYYSNSVDVAYYDINGTCLFDTTVVGEERDW